MNSNNTPPPDITAVHITNDRLGFDLEDGRTVSVPLAFYPTLMLAKRSDRDNFEICHSSVHWPTLDCDISSDGLLRGLKEARSFAQKARKRQGSTAPV